MKTVAILCASKRSVYYSFEGVDVYDQARDARSFPGGMPVVAHPPCRLWSAYCAHQAKSPDPENEKNLGLWCVDQVMRWGGVLEQPAHSRLWQAANLPKPGIGGTRNCFSREITQFDFGHAVLKRTWLFFSYVHPRDVPREPIRLKPQGGDRRAWQLMSSGGTRSSTPQPFAEWLIECARLSTAPIHHQRNK